MVSPRDVIILHDPQTAGLAPALARHGCRVVWRCHIGVDEPNDPARHAWDFLHPYVDAADACVFSRRAYAWEGLDPERLAFIAPAIDAFTPKNQELDGETTRAILARSGVLGRGDGRAGSFQRTDGSTGSVTVEVEKVEESSLPEDGPLVLQVSRWDPLKDPAGVMKAFAEHVAPKAAGDLVLAGPRDHAVKDDPGQAAVASEVAERWRELAPDVRRRVHLVHIPLEDDEQNAAIVSALQRRAEVVVQKSLAEGFGLTVSEAMWKARPVVASRVGGIEDQVEHGRSGLLVDDPHDLASFGAAVVELLKDGPRTERMGEAARQRVREHFLLPRQLLEQWQLIDRLLA
jgi:trehalose synthase